MRRKVGKRQPDQHSAMSGTACDVAVSEMIGWPLESLCGYVVLVVKHRPEGSHELAVMPASNDWPWVLRWLERAVADVRSTL